MTFNLGRLAFVLATLMSATALASEITGPSRVIDGDTVVVGDTHVRLAAERGTPRGDDATQVMLGIVNGGELRCVLTGEHTWRREVGWCFTSDGTDIGEAIIEMGAALSCPRYDPSYLKFEQADAVAVQQRAHYCVRH